jgi:anti-anti-sigma factor
MATIELKDLAPDIAVISVSGQLTTGADCQKLESQVDKLLGQRRTKFVFDLSGLNYMDSSAIGVVALSFGKATNAGGGLTVAGARGSVEELFHLTRISNIVKIFPDVPAAAAALAKKSGASA